MPTNNENSTQDTNPQASTKSIVNLFQLASKSHNIVLKRLFNAYSLYQHIEGVVDTLYGKTKTRGKHKVIDKMTAYQQQLELLTFNEKFYTDVVKFRNKYSIPSSYGLSEWQSVFDKTLKLPDSYNKDLHKLLRSHAIPLRWLRAVECYIWLNVTYLMLPRPAVVKIMRDITFDEGDSLAIQISPDTTKEDIVQAWGEVLEWQGRYLAKQNKHRTRPPLDPSLEIDGDEESNLVNAHINYRKNKADRPYNADVFEKYKRAYQLRNQGHPSRQIAKMLKEEGLDRGCTYNKVNSYIKEFKDYIDKNMLY